MRLCLVEDIAVAGLEPLTLTRPVFDLMLGGGTLASKIARAFGIGPGPHRRGVVIRPYLAAIQRQRDPHTVVNDRDWLARGPLVVANGRWVPPAGFAPPDTPRALAWPLRRPARLRPGRARRRGRPGGRRGRFLVRGHRGAVRRPRAGRRVDQSSLGPRGHQRRSRRPRLRRRGQGRGQQPPPRAPPRWSGRSTGSSSTSRPGSTRTRSSTPRTGRSRWPRARGSSRSPGSRGRATSAGTPSSSAPTSAAA